MNSNLPAGALNDPRAPWLDDDEEIIIDLDKQYNAEEKKAELINETKNDTQWEY